MDPQITAFFVLSALPTITPEADMALVTGALLILLRVRLLWERR